MRVAFLGLGAIGAPMARHLTASPLDVTLWNRTPGRAQPVAEGSTARIAGSPAEAVQAADVVITCLPSSVEVEELLTGELRLADALRAGSVFVDCTSGDPAASRRIARRLADRQVAFLDAPVSGGVRGAEQGRLTIMCGGERATFEHVRPVLERFGEKIVLIGPVGAGHALKAINNAMLAVHIWSLAEGLAALARSGIDPALALDVVNVSSGRSNASQNLFPERVLTGAFPRTFRLALLEKDVGIAASVARDEKVPSPLLQLTAELFRTGRLELGEEADHVEAVRLIERWANVEIRGGDA